MGPLKAVGPRGVSPVPPPPTCVRCALFLVFAFIISGDDSINLLVISLTTSGIFVWFTLLGKAYKSWYLNALELSFILNLGILAVAAYHNLVEARLLLHIPQLV